MVKLLRGICKSAKLTDGVITDKDGNLDELGKFWRASLGQFSLEDFGKWKKALAERKIETPDWFPPVGDIFEQITLARDLEQIGKVQTAPAAVPQLPGEVDHDHLRARIHGDDPVKGPMSQEWIKNRGDDPLHYRERMLAECEKIDPNLKILRKLRTNPEAKKNGSKNFE